MTRQLLIGVVVGVAIGAAGMRVMAQPAKVKGGFIVQHDAEIAKNEPGHEAEYRDGDRAMAWRHGHSSARP